MNITWRYSKKQHLLTRDEAHRLAAKGVAKKPPSHLAAKKVYRWGRALNLRFRSRSRGCTPIRGRIARWDPIGRYRIDFNRIARNPGPSRNLDAVAGSTELVVAH